jgi:hypothetical protein
MGHENMQGLNTDVIALGNFLSRTIFALDPYYNIYTVSSFPRDLRESRMEV